MLYKISKISKISRVKDSKTVFIFFQHFLHDVLRKGQKDIRKSGNSTEIKKKWRIDDEGKGKERKSSYPRKKYDMDSHGNSMSRQFLVTTRLGGGLVKIRTKFHENSMSFIQVLFAFHAKT